MRFREKRRIALAHVRRVLQAGFQLTAVVADAEYGSNAAFRRGLERMGLRYGLAIRSTLKMWATPHVRRTRTAVDFATDIPEDTWRRVCRGEGTKGPLVSRFAALRVRPAKSRGERWLLCERSLADDERKYYLLNLDASTPLRDLVALVRSRWPVEQQYRELSAQPQVPPDRPEGR